MAAGVFGYLGYDIVRLIEDLPPPREDCIGIPDAVLIRPTLILVFDAVKDTITIVTPVRRQDAVPAQIALARASGRLSAVVHALDRPLDKAAEIENETFHAKPASNTTPAEFKRMVMRANFAARLSETASTSCMASAIAAPFVASLIVSRDHERRTETLGGC